jgi:hypothetical protein
MGIFEFLFLFRPAHCSQSNKTPDFIAVHLQLLTQLVAYKHAGLTTKAR